MASKKTAWVGNIIIWVLIVFYIMVGVYEFSYYRGFDAYEEQLWDITNELDIGDCTIIINDSNITSISLCKNELLYIEGYGSFSNSIEADKI